MRADPRDRITSTRPQTSAGRRKASLILIMLAAVAVTSGIAVYLNRAASYAIFSDVVARFNPKAQMSARRLVNEPCNRTLAAELVSDLQDKAEFAAIIAFVGQSERRCGPNEDLLTDLFFAQTGSSDFSGAERTASQLVTQYQADPHVYEWRAQVREKRGDIVGAYVDMRTALSLFPDPLNVTLSVYDYAARLAERTGRPCDAVATLRDYIAFDPENRRTPQLTTVMRNWQQSGACPLMSGTGTAFVRFSPNGRVAVIPVVVNGILARMEVDTGADRVLLTNRFAASARIDTADLQIINTANGEAVVFGGRADYISVDGARVNRVPVLITRSSIGDGIDGLLGLSFLREFKWSPDYEHGSLELRPIE
jgi:hypothetical protein